MRNRGLYSMSFVMRICACVIFLCFGAVLLCACTSGALHGIQEKDSVASVITETDASVKNTGILDSDTRVSETQENEQITRKGFNPEMAFNYDEHEDIEVNEDYVTGLCAEAVRELEGMFGPAEFFVKAQHNEDDSYIISVEYNKQAASFTEEELKQIKMYINQEYKEVTLSEINIQGW